jgi:putative tryptophan/tyrosine transport system substrate-binding protein
MRRRDFICIAASAVLTTAPAFAQSGKNQHRIGTLGNLPPSNRPVQVLWDEFIAGLREHGWIESENIIIDARWVEGRPERYATFAAELVALQPDVLVALGGSQPTKELKARTRTIPIVMQGVSHPVEAGYVASLSRPGGNVTGLTNQLSDIGLKYGELMREIVPGLERFGIIWEPENDGSRLAVADFQRIAPRLGMTLILAPLRVDSDIDGAFAILQRERAQVVQVHPTVIASHRRNEIISFANAQRLPTLTPADVNMRAGYLVSYGPDWPAMYRRAAYYVDRLLRGAAAADLPVEQPTRFSLGINLTTARKIGVEIPATLLARADEVVD